MKLTIEFSKFEPWAGAVDTWNKIVEAGKIDELEATLEEIYPESISDTELNDILWFDSEVVFDWLGMNDEEDEDSDFDKFCRHFSSCGFCPLYGESHVYECEELFERKGHDKMMACIDGQDENVYDKNIFNSCT